MSNKLYTGDGVNEGSITGIFPIPIYQTEMNREWREEEKKIWEENSWHRSVGNLSSSDVYVLDRMPELKSDIETVVDDYWYKVVTTASDCTWVLTQSWLNKTEVGKYHHRHNHSNSLISGVVYLETDVTDTITFFREERNLLSLTVENYHLFNSPSWKFSVKSGDILLFPSHLHHMVEEKIDGAERISLAFNAWVSGTIGVAKDMTELEIESDFRHLRKNY